jgi:hypothetical protein
MARRDRGVAAARRSARACSITQAVLSGGLVFLAVLAERFFGLRRQRRQWIGITVTAIGLAIIGLTGTGSRRPEHASLAALISVECSIFALGAVLVSVSMHRHITDRPESLMLGIAAGALFGVSEAARLRFPVGRIARPISVRVRSCCSRTSRASQHTISREGTHGNWNREVVQRRQGLRLHHA